jgi:proline iminopeptidase
MPFRKPIMDLFPPIEPYSTGFLKVDDTHELYWEQSGNPDGVPLIYFHGGPGGGCSPLMRQFFDPNHYRIILFDQRGCGKSHPLGSLKDNTTAHLLDDIEKLREHLGIEKWHTYGGSWGSTLALCYASQYPERCHSMILRGVFLMTHEEIDWFLHGAKNIFPEAWEQFVAPLNEEERKDILRSYYNKFTSDDKEEAVDAAINWALYESACASLIPNYQTITTEEQKNKAYSISKIEAHYFLNENFDRDYDLINKVDIFRHIPTVIIQGRYDAVCPIKTAYALHKKWPEAEFIVVPDGGHSSLDHSMRTNLIAATENFKNLNLTPYKE